MRKGPVLPALFFALPVADVLPVVLPAPSLGKHCRPVVLPVKIGPTLPAGCRRAALPARGAADVLRCRSTPGRLPHAPGRSLGKRCRPVVLPGQDRLPAPRSRPVTREALPARGAADVLRCRSRSAPRSRPVVLPTCCAPGRLPTCCPWCCRPRHSGSVAGPWCCPVKIGCRPRGAAGPVNSSICGAITARRNRAV
jgi:hypothetical protein